MKTRDELEEMTKPELMEFGKTLSPPVLLELPQKKGDMVVAILRATGSPVEVETDSVKPEKRADDLPPVNRLSSLDGSAVEKRVYELTIHSTETDRSDVSVTINGYHYKIQRGARVKVPAAVVEVLRNSTINTVRYNPQTKKNEPVTILTYPFDAVAV